MEHEEIRRYHRENTFDPGTLNKIYTKEAFYD